MKNKNEIEKIERKIIPLLKKHNVSRAGMREENKTNAAM